jgi:S-adenosylmethionine/arginine decarboxylase-like enzyme
MESSNSRRDVITLPPDAWGMSCSIDIQHCNPEKIRSPAALQDFVIQLCKLIDMKRFGDVQVVHFGSGNKEGLTLVQLIETSSITGHFANDNNSAYLDIFSCKYFSPHVVGEFSQTFFEGSEVGISVTIRK